jgi:hypothetical protein
MTAPERQLPARPFAAEHALLCWTRDDKEGSDAAGGVAQRGERSNLRANRSSPRVGRPASLVDYRRVSDIVIGACSGTTDVVTHSYDLRRAPRPDPRGPLSRVAVRPAAPTAPPNSNARVTPNDTPHDGLSHTNLGRVLVKHEEIDRQHHEDKGVESNPPPRLVHDSSGSWARCAPTTRGQLAPRCRQKKRRDPRSGASATRAKVSPCPSGT